MSAHAKQSKRTRPSQDKARHEKLVEHNGLVNEHAQRQDMGQDGPSVPQADELAQEDAGVFQFEHPLDPDRTCVLPTALRFGVLRKAAKAGDDFAQMVAVLEAVADNNALAAIDAMTLPQVQELFTSWQEAIGASLGNSSASPA